MVSEKKVNKRSVISGKEDDNKPVSKKPAVEFLDMASPVPDQISIPPAGVTNIDPAINSQVPITETEDYKRNSIYGNEPILKKPEAQSSILKNVVLIFFSVIVIFWLSVVILSIEVHTGPHIAERNISIIRKVPINLSFDDMLGSQDVGQEISLMGMLRTIRINTTPPGNKLESHKDVTYIIDDYGKRIEAQIKLSQRSDYEKLFTTNEKVKTVYNVTGLYRNSSYGYIIFEVSSIQPYSRQLLEISEWGTENISIPDTKGLKFNIALGWSRISSLI
jgi:hypothetical protein